MVERDLRADVAGLLAQRRTRTSDTPQEITDADFQGIQRWLSEVLRVTREQIADAFEEYQCRANKRPVLDRGTWQGKLADPGFASVRLTKRAGAKDLSYDVRAGMNDGQRIPSVTLPQGRLSGTTERRKDGQIGPTTGGAGGHGRRGRR